MLIIINRIQLLYYSSFNNIDTLLGKKCDVILPEPIVDRFSAGIRLLHGVCVEDINIFLSVIKEQSPEYYSSALSYLRHNRWIGFNMFVMRKKLFDEFAQWQFSLLQVIEEYVKLSEYTRMKRLFGYLGEVMLAIWCLHNKLEVFYDKVVPYPDSKVSLSMLKSVLYKMYNSTAFFFQREDLHWLNSPSIIVGLKNDGIYDEVGHLKK